MSLKNNLIFIFFFILSCQPIETLVPLQFDYSKFDKLSINANEILINLKYDSIFSEENIEDQVTNPPLKILKKWIDKNINIFGKQNKFIINIYDASISKREIENIDAQKYEEKTIFIYEVSFLVEYELYDSNDYLLANTTVESFRSTTSRKYISLNEKEIIINDLLNKAIKEFVTETKSMTNLYMSEYIS